MLTADALANTGPSNLNLYPRKKELERQMARIEAELSKSQKELFSLNQMMETYQNNPKFGNSKKFQSEIQNLHSHVSELESALTSIRAEHVQVEERLGALRARTSSPNIRLSPTARLQRGGNIIRQKDNWSYLIECKIRRGPKLESDAFANFGYSSGTEGESRRFSSGLSVLRGGQIRLFPVKFRSLCVEKRSDPV